MRRALMFAVLDDLLLARCGQASNFAVKNRRFKFEKRSRLFICPHNETLSVAAMGVCNPDRSAVTIQHQKPERTLIAWRCCNGRPKSETANPNRGTTLPHSCYASRDSIFLYSVSYGRGTLGGMPHA